MPSCTHERDRKRTYSLRFQKTLTFMSNRNIANGSLDFRDHWYCDSDPFDTGAVWCRSQCVFETKSKHAPTGSQSRRPSITNHRDVPMTQPHATLFLKFTIRIYLGRFQKTLTSVSNRACIKPVVMAVQSSGTAGTGIQAHLILARFDTKVSVF